MHDVALEDAKIQDGVAIVAEGRVAESVITELDRLASTTSRIATDGALNSTVGEAGDLHVRVGRGGSSGVSSARSTDL